MTSVLEVIVFSFQDCFHSGDQAAKKKAQAAKKKAQAAKKKAQAAKKKEQQGGKRREVSCGGMPFGQCDAPGTKPSFCFHRHLCQGMIRGRLR